MIMHAMVMMTIELARGGMDSSFGRVYIVFMDDSRVFFFYTLDNNNIWLMYAKDKTCTG